MNGKRRRIIIIILGIIVAIMAGTIVIRGVKTFLSAPEETNQGIEVIKAQESADVKSIESKISKLEKASAEENGEEELPWNERFADSVVMGDSIAKGFKDYGVLDAANVAAESGATVVADAEKLLDQAAVAEPKYLFIVLGNNDLTGLHGDAGAFEEAYRAMLEDVKATLPKAYIFANAIFPVQEDVIAAKPVYGEIDEYNKVIKDLCKEYEITYLDASDLPENSDYEEDGIHFRADFYEIWAEYMAEEAAL